MAFLATKIALVALVLAAAGNEPEAAVQSRAAARPTGNQPPSESIDWARVQQLLKQEKAGEKLSAEEQAYLDHAKAVRQQTHGRAVGAASPRAQATPSVTTYKSSKHPDIENQKYGPSASNVLDLWQAKSSHPTPLVIYIHGRGFMAGDKTQIEGRLINECLPAGISVASINYRLSQEALAPAAMYDGARAVQFLRSKAKEWNLDPTRICLTGGSAGAGISLWIGFHDDLADPKSADPIARESTRVTCVAPFNAQTTYDPRVLKTIINSDEYKRPRTGYPAPPLMAFFGVKEEALFESPTPELAQLYEEVSPVNFLTADDPPVFINYQAEVNGMHSIRLGTLLKNKMDALHIECTIHGPKTPAYDAEQMEFIKKHLLGSETSQKTTPTTQGATPTSRKAKLTSQKATPTGIWLLAFSYSPRHPDMVDKLSASPCWTNPNVDGIVLRAHWSQIEPTEGQIDWSYFDRGFELAQKHDKQIEIIVIGGKFSPEWVYAAGAKTFSFRGMQNKLYDMPIPWDPVLREKFGAMINKVGQRYDSSPYLSLVTMTGFARATDSWFAGPPEMEQYNAIGGTAKWLEGAKWFAAIYNQAFPTTPFLISICPPSKDDEGRTTIQKFVEDCVKDYGGRFGFYATSLVPNNKLDNPKSSYQYVKKFSDQAVTGLEMLGPLRPSQGPLKAALDTAIAQKAQFVHAYEPDLIDPKQQPVLAEARTQLKQYQLVKGAGQKTAASQDSAEDKQAKSQDKSKQQRRASVQQGPSIQPTLSDVSYGPDKSNTLDLWLAKSDSPTPLIIFIHGGGFHEGDKRNYPNFEDALLQQALDQKIAFASLNYRLTKDGFSYPAPMHDCARAVQYIRSRAKEWNLDPKRFAATGRSAGAGISEWLAFHDDMAKPNSSDPVERQSTRLSCCVPINMQSTYDPRVIKTLIPGNPAVTYQTPDLKLLYGLPKTFDWDKDKIDEALDAKLKDASPVTHLTKDDPPALAINQNTQNIHSPNMAVYLKQHMDQLGIECERHMESEFSNPVDRANTILEFIKRQFEDHPLP